MCGYEKVVLWQSKGSILHTKSPVDCRRKNLPLKMYPFLESDTYGGEVQLLIALENLVEKKTTCCEFLCQLQRNGETSHFFSSPSWYVKCNHKHEKTPPQHHHISILNMSTQGYPK